VGFGEHVFTANAENCCAQEYARCVRNRQASRMA
jgi:hypothetical protein